MEAPHGNNTSSRLSQLKVLDGNVSPINAQRDNNHQFFIGGGRFHHPSKSPSSAIDKNNLENLDSTLIRYLRSRSPASATTGDAFKTPAIDSPKYYNSGGSSGFGSRGSSSVSPLSALENLEPSVFKTPVKVEEDVLVMDGILVRSGAGGRLRSLTSSDSGGSSSSSGSNSFFKTEICRSWEDFSHCRYGSKCQVCVSLPFSLAQMCKSYSSSGSCSYGARCRFVHHQVVAAASPTEPAVTDVALAKTQTISPVKPENSNGSLSVTVTNTDWSPEDDGIEVTLPCSSSPEKIPSREAVDAYINNVLYGPSRRKRLPVFAEICPE
ncbi:hypothetical protein HYC85_009862 [Camellia sinensis]|uniref:C3H1-type domain-containing protein n=1 Tax=Camellia sinensis TaxID=4442 RepID=A0A7J7HIV5_CAMSI|nr:hypothetical protein HYC85_009862 [Camellia sinensis]